MRFFQTEAEANALGLVTSGLSPTVIRMLKVCATALHWTENTFVLKSSIDGFVCGYLPTPTEVRDFVSSVFAGQRGLLEEGSRYFGGIFGVELVYDHRREGYWGCLTLNISWNHRRKRLWGFLRCYRPA